MLFKSYRNTTGHGVPGGTPTRILSESGCLLSGAGRQDLRGCADRQGDSRHGVASAARQVGTGALGTAATATGHAELILEIIERRSAGIDACANLALSDSVTNTNVHETNYLESPCHMQASSCLPGPGVFPVRRRPVRPCAGRGPDRAAGNARIPPLPPARTFQQQRFPPPATWLP